MTSDVRRLVIIVPELLSEQEPILDRGLPGLSRLESLSRPARLSRLEPVETPEARWLGLDPESARLRQGPLTVAALGADPPPRSTHFHVSLMSVVEGVVGPAEPPPTAEEVRTVTEAAKKLDTRLLTFLSGSGTDHALVWEAVGDLRTVPGIEAIGKTVRESLPEGDGESGFRRYIDDSVNLLNELNLNRRRLDDGYVPINLLWPWGQGIRRPVPNLALRRGEPALVLARGLRIAGLTRLAGYRFADIGAHGGGLQLDLRGVGAAILRATSAIVVLDGIAACRVAKESEEAAYLVRKLDVELVLPILEQAAGEPTRLLLAAPSALGMGVALDFISTNPTSSSYPFDERTIGEVKVPVEDLETCVDHALAPDRAAQ